MKIFIKLIVGVVFFCNTVYANESLKSIYENVILKNSQDSLVEIKKLKKVISQNKEAEIKNQFTSFVKSWKSVQAFYILGDLDDNYLDTPRYIDIFHHGNEDITKQLDLIIQSKEDLSISLYKNSHKTVNALEYILFTKDLHNKKIQQIALIITDKIEENLQEIYDGYVASKEVFVKDELASNAMMLNALIENSYKLKEWRIGDPSGLSRKFKGKPSNERAEYYLSKNSIEAIKSILKTHLEVLDNQNYENFGTMIRSYDVNDELNDAVRYLQNSLKKANDIQNDDFTNAKKLYKEVRKVHATYYISLIGKLQITAKILDADGD